MVMTETSRLLHSPLAVVDRLFAEHRQSSSGASGTAEVEDAVRRHFERVFDSDAAVAKIPSLTNPSTPAASLPTSSLVRFRCLAQDTGLGGELYASCPDGRTGCGMYREPASIDLSDSAAAAVAAAKAPYDQLALSEREVVFAVSIPGEAAWVVEALDSEGVPSPNPDADEDVTGRLDGLSMSSSTVIERKADPLELAATKDKFPLGQDTARRRKGAPPAVAAVLKFYNGAKAETGVKAADAIEVVGVLGWTQFSPDATMDDDPLAASASRSSAPNGTPAAAVEPTVVDVIPCIHVVFHRRAPAPTWLRSPKSQTQKAKVRQGLVRYVAAKVFGGDEVAAEYLVLAMTAQIHSRVGGTALGSFPLNFISPSDPSSVDTAVLPSLLDSLLPRSATRPLTIASLSSRSFVPSSSHDSSSLTSGPLQLAPGTLLHLDARGMGEGQVSEVGLRNVRAIERVVSEGKVGYRFPFAEFDFEVDIGIVVSSQGGKTFLSGLWPVFVEPSSTPTTRIDEPSASDLSSWREFLAGARKTQPTVPPSLAGPIQETFLSARSGSKTPAEADGKMSQTDLGRRLEVARGLAKLRLAAEGAPEEAKGEVGVEDWKRAGTLEEKRRQRERRREGRKVVV